jgi:hypothetical protein
LKLVARQMTTPARRGKTRNDAKLMRTEKQTPKSATKAAQRFEAKRRHTERL